MKKVIGLLAVLSLFGLVIPALADDITVPELLNTPADNMMLENFNGVGTTYMVADQWHTFLINDPEGMIVVDDEGGAKMKFFRDISNGTNNDHITYPYNPHGAGPVSTASQGIAVGRYLDGTSEKFAAAGIFRTVDVGPNYQDKVYLFHGYLDIWQGGSFGFGQTYRPCFGINPKGSTSPGEIPKNNDFFTEVAGKHTNIGDANWMIPEASSGFQSVSGGFPSEVGGFHGVAAAWPAEASTISLWAGVKVRSSGSGNSGLGETFPLDSSPVWTGDHFEVDSLSLHEFSFVTPYPVLSVGVSNGLINGNFEGDTLFIRNTLNNDPENAHPGCQYYPDWRIPYGWVPIGGGIAQAGGTESAASAYFAWTVESRFADTANNPSSTKGFATVTRRGTNFMGIMQKVQVQLPAEADPTTYKLKLVVRAKVDNQNKRAQVGIDPLGGTNPAAASVKWKETNTFYDGTNWTTLQLEEACLTSTSQTITVFLMSRGIYLHNADIYGGTTDTYCGASFDDARLSIIPPSDPTPPAAFNVIIDNSADETHRLRFHLSIPPTDPESGISAQNFKIGTTPGGGEIRDNIQANLDQQYFDVYDIVLPDGQNIYVTVTQTNGLGMTTTATSPAFLVDAINNGYQWSPTGEHVSYSALGGSDSPSIVCGPNGKVYLAYRDSDGREGSGGSGVMPWWSIPAWAGWDSKIVFRARENGIWGEAKVIAANPAEAGPEGAGAWDTSLAIDSTGAIHCVYQMAGTYYRNDLYDAVSTNGGSTWTNNYIGPGTGTDWVNWCNKAVPYMNSILVGVNKTRRVAWPEPDNSPGSNTRYLPSVVAVNGGTGTFEPIEGAIENSMAGRPTPSIATLGSNIYAIWPEENGELKFAMKNGGSWSAATTIAASSVTARSGNGDYAIAVESGKIHVVYTTDHLQGADTTQPGVWYVSSTDNGATWSTPKYTLGGCWPMIKVRNGRVHIIAFERSGAEPNYKYQPKHMFIDNGVLSVARAIAPAAFTAQPSEHRTKREEYSWNKMTISHLVPGSFDIDASGNLHFVWASDPNSRNYWWVDYYNTAGDVSPCTSLSCLVRWAADEKVWREGIAPRKTISVSDLIVTARGTITPLFGGIPLPYIYVEDVNRTMGIRAICPQNMNSDPSDDIDVGHKVNIVNSAVTVNLVGLDDPMVELDEWETFGEPQIGRMNELGNPKDVTIQPVSTGNSILPLGLLNKNAGGLGIPGIPEVFDGFPSDPKYIAGVPTTGLYVTVFGKVGYAFPGEWFYLDDGSGAEGEWDRFTGARVKGVKVYGKNVGDFGTWVGPDEFWSVRGVVGTERAIIYDDGMGNIEVGQIRVIRPVKDEPQYFQKY